MKKLVTEVFEQGSNCEYFPRRVVYKLFNINHFEENKIVQLSKTLRKNFACGLRGSIVIKTDAGMPIRYECYECIKLTQRGKELLYKLDIESNLKKYLLNNNITL